MQWIDKIKSALDALVWLHEYNRLVAHRDKANDAVQQMSRVSISFEDRDLFSCDFTIEASIVFII